MDVVWIVAGAMLLVITLVDVLLTVINYDEIGPLTDRVIRGTWVIIRALTRTLSRRWRPLALRQVTGLILIATILWWIAGMVIGYGLIYLGAIGLGGLRLEPDAPEPFWAAISYSIGQFATVGVDNMTTVAPAVALLSAAQALTSVVLISMTVAFLLSVFGVARDLRDLCAIFARPGTGVGEPATTLVAFFPGGEPRDIDGLVQRIDAALGAYIDSLRQNRAGYYFQSGRDQFSMPFAVYMSAGVAAALRWGLPRDFAATQAPALTNLDATLHAMRSWLGQAIGYRQRPLPEPLTRQGFSEQLTRLADATRLGGTVGEEPDPWVTRFTALCGRMRALAAPGETGLEPGDLDRDEAYERYCGWLPFAARTQWFVQSASADLDYQPVYTETLAGPVSGVLPPAGTDRARTGPTGAAIDSAGPGGGRFRAWVRRRSLFIDPGGFRLSTALRALLAAGAAVTGALAVSAALGGDAARSAVIAGMLTIFVAPAAAPWGKGLGRLGGLLALVPVVGMLVIGAFVPEHLVFSITAMAVVAFLAVWSGRLGPRVGALGQVAFVVFFFSVLMGESPSSMVSFVAAGSISVVVCVLSAAIPEPGVRSRVLGAGIDGIAARADAFIEALIGAVAVGSPDRASIRRLEAEARSVRTAGSALAGRLDIVQDDRGITPEESLTLRLRVADVELAVSGLAGLYPLVGSDAVTVAERASLAAALARLRSDDAVTGAPPGVTVPRSAQARRLLAAIESLAAALSALRRGVATAGDAPADGGGGAEQAPELTPRPVIPEAPVPAAALAAPVALAAPRRAAQAGISTGLALVVGTLVSPTHQFWAAMPAFQVLQNSGGETRAVALQRVAITVVGTVVAFTVAVAVSHLVWADLLLLAVCVFAIGFVRSVAPLWHAFWTTAQFALMYDALGKLSIETVWLRVVETAVGASVAVAVALLVMPLRTRTRMQSALGQAVQAVQRTVALAIAARQRSGPTPSAEADELEGMLRATGAAERLALAVRRDPGALHRDGVEARITMLWALVFDARAMIGTDGASGLAAGIWHELREATDRRFESVSSVLDSSSGPVSFGALDVSSFVADPAVLTVADRRALVALQRVNDELVALASSLRPSAAPAHSG